MTNQQATRPSVAGKSVLIAGATGGLGSEIGAELVRRGAELTLVSRQPDRLDDLAVPGRRLALDLRDPESAHKAVDFAVGAAGRLDVVVNAVGVVAFGPVTDLSVDAMEELFLVNAFVPIALAKAALPVLSPGGAIVNISGVIAEQNLPGMAAYGATKAASRSFAEGLRREARRHKVRVVDARPPHTETGLADRAIEGQAPNMPTGLEAATVARIIVDAIEDGPDDLPSQAFVPGTAATG